MDKEALKTDLKKLQNDYELIRAMEASLEASQKKLQADTVTFSIKYLGIEKEKNFSLFEAIQRTVDAIG